MAFTVRLTQGNGWISFENPRELLCAGTLLEVEQAFAAAERAVNEGSWIAGFLSYPGAASQLTIGVFDEPVSWEPPVEDFQ